jgi:hypothetical protein
MSSGQDMRECIEVRPGTDLDVIVGLLDPRIVISHFDIGGVKQLELSPAVNVLPRPVVRKGPDRRGWRRPAS